MKIILNGNLAESGHSAEIFEPGFLFGWGAFEVLRIYNKHIPFLSEHIDRLKSTLEKMALDLPKVDFNEKIKDLLEENDLKDAYCRICVWRKRNGIGYYVYVVPFSYYKDDDYKKGFRARVSPDHFTCEAGKTLSYLPRRIAWFRAQQSGKDEAILTDTQGYLLGGARSNLFFIKDNTVFVPQSDYYGFFGITAEKVLRILNKIGIKLKFKQCVTEELIAAEEAFLTSSLLEVMPLSSCEYKGGEKEFKKKTVYIILEEYRKQVYG